MQIIYRTSDYVDACLKKSLLEEAGLLVHMGNQNFGSVDAPVAMADGFTLHVVDDDITEAKALIASMPVGSAMPPTVLGCDMPDHFTADITPDVADFLAQDGQEQHRSLSMVNMLKWLAVIMIILFVLPFLLSLS